MLIISVNQRLVMLPLPIDIIFTIGISSFASQGCQKLYRTLWHVLIHLVDPYLSTTHIFVCKVNLQRTEIIEYYDWHIRHS